MRLNILGLVLVAAALSFPSVGFGSDEPVIVQTDPMSDEITVSLVNLAHKVARKETPGSISYLFLGLSYTPSLGPSVLLSVVRLSNERGRFRSVEMRVDDQAMEKFDCVDTSVEEVPGSRGVYITDCFALVPLDFIDGVSKGKKVLVRSAGILGEMNLPLVRQWHGVLGEHFPDAKKKK